MSEQKYKNLVPPGNDTTGNPAEEANRREAADDQKATIVLGEDDLKEISLTNDEIEAVTRKEPDEETRAGSSGKEEKDFTD